MQGTKDISRTVSWIHTTTMFKQQPRSKSCKWTIPTYSIISKGQLQKAVIGVVLCHTIIFWPNDKEQHSLPTSISKAANVSTPPIASAQDSVHIFSQGLCLRICRLFIGWASPKWCLSCSGLDASASSQCRGKSWRLPLFQNGRMYSSGKKKKRKDWIWTSQKSNFCFFHFGNIASGTFCFIYFSTVFGTLLIFLNDFYDTNNVSKVWMEYIYPINTIFSKSLLHHVLLNINSSHMLSCQQTSV